MRRGRLSRWLTITSLAVLPHQLLAQADPGRVPADESHSAIGAAVASSLRLLVLEHAGRIVFQERTRRELKGPFFRDYARSLRLPTTWKDGDTWLVNYIGHPIHGAAAGRTWLEHHPGPDLEIGLSGAYWSSRARAAAWAALYSVQFEFGPLSEASIGNIGLRPGRTGWVDHVVTPVGAFGMIVAEDALDRCVVQWVERKVGNRALRASARILLNPSRSLANIVDGRTPWFRARGPLR